MARESCVFLFMTRHKCSECNRPAIAYRLDGDGTRAYLCDRHIPLDDKDDIALGNEMARTVATRQISKDQQR